MKNLFLSLFIFSQLFILSCSNNIKNDPEKTAEVVSQYDSLEEKAAKMKMIYDEAEAHLVNNSEKTAEPTLNELRSYNEQMLNIFALKPGRDYFIKGNTNSDLKNYQEAIANYNKSIELDPKHFGAWYCRGFSKYQLQDYRGAIADLIEAIKLNPVYSDTWYYRGISKHQIKDLSGAIADYNIAIEINPKYTDAYLNRGLAKISLGQKDSGCLDLSKAGELGSGQAYEQIKKYCN
ncbi:MAG: tetratricopeptide repeat protein [Bacteroidota bacterium]